MTDDVTLRECPYCHATTVSVERVDGILVGDCDCMLTQLDVRRRGGYTRREVASI